MSPAVPSVAGLVLDRRPVSGVDRAEHGDAASDFDGVETARHLVGIGRPRSFVLPTRMRRLSGLSVQSEAWKAGRLRTLMAALHSEPGSFVSGFSLRNLGVAFHHSPTFADHVTFTQAPPTVRIVRCLSSRCPGSRPHDASTPAASTPPGTGSPQRGLSFHSSSSPSLMASSSPPSISLTTSSYFGVGNDASANRGPPHRGGSLPPSAEASSLSRAVNA